MADKWMLLLGGCNRQVGISGSMVDMWLLLLSGCCRQVGIVVFLVVW